MTPPHLTDAQIEEMLAQLVEVIEVCGEVFMPIFERVLAEHERRQQLREKLAAFKRTPSANHQETAEQFS